MQPLVIIIAIVAIAAVGMSSGFLFGTTTFSLIAQDLGAKETDLRSPIDTARVDFVIHTLRVVGDSNSGAAGAGVIKTAYRNLITACSFHSDDDIPRSGAIICKLTHNNNIVAEGRLDLTTTSYQHSDQTYIPIAHTAYPYSNDVQNINDVKIIVLGDNPTCDYLELDDPVGTTQEQADALPACPV